MEEHFKTMLLSKSDDRFCLVKDNLSISNIISKFCEVKDWMHKQVFLI